MNSLIFAQMVAHFGCQSDLARQLNVTRSAVSQWRRRKRIPPAHAVKIEMLSDGEFKAVDLV
jgi:DNA-binding transcriptional regulator YdaS (Cro superfamily)